MLQNSSSQALFSRTVAYRSEVIKNDLNPKWQQCEVTTQSLCYGNPQQPFDIECYDYDSDGGQA